MVERYVRDVEVAGSKPVTPIFLLGYRKAMYLLALRFLFSKYKTAAYMFYSSKAIVAYYIYTLI